MQSPERWLVRDRLVEARKVGLLEGVESGAERDPGIEDADRRPPSGSTASGDPPVRLHGSTGLSGKMAGSSGPFARPIHVREGALPRAVVPPFDALPVVAWRIPQL